MSNKEDDQPELIPGDDYEISCDVCEECGVGDGDHSLECSMYGEEPEL